MGEKKARSSRNFGKEFKMIPRHWQLIFTSLIWFLLIATFSHVVFAYSDYGGCQSCQGGFDGSNYTSQTDGTPWNQNIMEGHEPFVGGECGACRKAGDKSSVYLNSSIDSTLSADLIYRQV